MVLLKDTSSTSYKGSFQDHNQFKKKEKPSLGREGGKSLKETTSQRRPLVWEKRESFNISRRLTKEKNRERGRSVSVNQKNYVKKPEGTGLRAGESRMKGGMNPRAAILETSG